MAKTIRITDELSCIKMDNNGEILFIQKKQIKTVDTIRNDTVRIDIGEGHLNNIFINYNDVLIPANLASGTALRDAIKTMLDADDGTLDPTLANQVIELQLLTDLKTEGTTQTGLLNDLKTGQTAQGNTLTSIKTVQDNQAALLGEIKSDQETGNTYLQSMVTLLTQLNTTMSAANSSTAFGDPSRIDESEPSEVLYGYAPAGANPAAPVWAIKRVRRSGDEIITEWADGNQQFNKIWDERSTLTYLPL